MPAPNIEQEHAACLGLRSRLPCREQLIPAAARSISDHDHALFAVSSAARPPESK